MEEAIEAEDRVPEEIPKDLRKAAGGKVRIKWVDPRRAARRGRKQLPSWAGACGWLGQRLSEVSKTMQLMDQGMQNSWCLTDKDIKKWEGQAQHLEQLLVSTVKLKRKHALPT